MDDYDCTYDVIIIETGEILMEGFPVAAGAVIWASERGWKIMGVESLNDSEIRRLNDSRSSEGWPEIWCLAVYVGH